MVNSVKKPYSFNSVRVRLAMLLQLPVSKLLVIDITTLNLIRHKCYFPFLYKSVRDGCAPPSLLPAYFLPGFFGAGFEPLAIVNNLQKLLPALLRTLGSGLLSLSSFLSHSYLPPSKA